MLNITNQLQLIANRSFNMLNITNQLQLIANRSFNILNITNQLQLIANRSFNVLNITNQRFIIYMLQGAIAIAGASVKWLRDNLGIIKTAAEVG
jgi:hypothetical protein